MRSDTSAFGMYKAYHAAEKTEYRLSAETMLSYSKEDIQALATQIYQETLIQATPSTLSSDPDAHTVSITLGTPGRRIEPQTVIDAVCLAFDSMDFSDISLDYEPVEVDLDTVRRLAQQGAATYCSDPVEPTVYADSEAHAIDVTMGSPGYTMNADDLYVLAESAVNSGDYGTVTLDMTEVDPTDVDITAAYGELASEPTEPYYSGGTVHEGSYGYSLDWDTAVADILAASWGETLEIPMTPIAPEKTAAEIQAVLFRDKLSSYSSPHTAIANRTTNLTLACKAINGTVLNPGETFSFNGIVGERTAAKGYKEATVYVGTESVGELGGGICQVASTIYDAVLYADLEVTVRAPHIFYVTYVPGGLDATVYWGSQDFCFRNNTEYPIRVNASVSGGYVNISIDGTKTNNNYVKLSYNKLSTVPYSTVTKYDSSLPSGTSKETTSPYTGYTYEAYQYVYDGNGNLLETNYLGKSTYQKRDQVITVGTG
jgi:vancomycin resistance protein YoaR